MDLQAAPSFPLNGCTFIFTEATTAFAFIKLDFPSYIAVIFSTNSSIVYLKN